MRKPLMGVVSALLLALASCTSGAPTSGPAAKLASGEQLPSGCPTGTPGVTDTAAFVADGRAWALGPGGGELSCLFPDVADPGPFIWGPLGDRVLLGDLQVDGLGKAPSREPQPIQPGPASWGHPQGLAVVFVSQDGQSIQKLFLDRDQVRTIAHGGEGVRYLNVIYHPSGLALAYVVDRGGKQSIWMSNNVGKDQHRVVFTKEGTKFGALAFSPDGRNLYYAAQHKEGYAELHRLELTTNRIPGLWQGEGDHIQDIWPAPKGGALAMTLGNSCADASAVILKTQGGGVAPALPGASEATRVLGWLDDDSVLVAGGGCDAPIRLSSVDVSSGSQTPLVSGVAAASVRTPAPKPVPKLPQPKGADIKSGAA